MMRQLSIVAGAKMLIGTPAKPMPRERSEAIARLVSSIAGVSEAHLPQCFAVGAMESPAQILVLAIDPAADQQLVLASIDEGLSRIIPENEHLDVWPLSPENPMLNSVRPAGCQIFATGYKRPWWRFW
jgi:hypothetical protein